MGTAARLSCSADWAARLLATKRFSAAGKGVDIGPIIADHGAPNWPVSDPWSAAVVWRHEPAHPCPDPDRRRRHRRLFPAYHLTKLGRKDVLLLEQGRLTCGTTWHAAGLVGQMRPNRNMTRMSKYGIELYATLEVETGLATGWKQCGSLNVASTPERWRCLKSRPRWRAASASRCR